MSDEKALKQIKKAKEDVLFWLECAEKDTKRYSEAENERKKAKFLKSVESDKKSIQYAVNKVIKLGGDVDDIVKQLSETQREIWMSLSVLNQSEVEKEIARIKKLLHQLKEMMEEDSYCSDDDIELKMKNKLFREEAFVGYRLNKAGEKVRLSGKPNAGYNDYWNYARDYATTKEQYFTQEEQQLIQKCLESRQEEKAYLVEKRAWLGKLGSGLLETAEKMDAWGDLAQAKFWVRNLYQDACPFIIREMYGKLPKAEEEQKCKEMTRRYLEFLRSEEQIAELSRVYADTEKEAEELRMKLRTFSFQNDDFLSGKNDREMRELIRIMDQDVNGQSLLTLYLLREKIGMEKTAFISQYKYDPILDMRKELLNKFSFEELGL